MSGTTIEGPAPAAIGGTRWWKAWVPRSLRLRLILVVVVTMTATQVVFFSTIVTQTSNFEKIRRGERMALFISQQQQGAKSEFPPYTLPFERAFKKYDVPPIKPVVTINDAPVAGPPAEGDAQLLELMRPLLPELLQVTYHAESRTFALPMSLSYEMTVWLQPADGVLRQVTVSSPALLGAPAYSLGPYIDLIVRSLIGIGLALLITSWITRPLSRLTAAADATMPSVKPTATHAAGGSSTEPLEIAETLAAFERMRSRITSLLDERTAMLRALAHDLRTPLTKLLLRLELAGDSALRTDAVQDCVRMQRLIASTLEYLRSAESGQAATPLSIRHCIQVAINERGADAVCRVATEGEDALVLIHEWALMRILANLIENGLKYAGKVWVTVHLIEGGVQLVIEDNGAGVPNDALSRVTEPFYRVDAARDDLRGGSGLGLSIVQNLVSAADGELAISNGLTAERPGLRVVVRFGSVT